MINLAIQLLAGQLNQHLKRTYAVNEDVAIVSNLLEMDGSVAPNIHNKLVIFLTNIEKDAVSASLGGNQGFGERALQRNTALHFNLYVMMTANFTGNNYAEALKFLSSTISFFQRNPMFSHHTVPEMDKRIEKLVLDIENLSVQDQSNLWSTLGGKYMPSILYRVRMVTFDSEDIIGRQPVVTVPESSVPPMGNN
ncbi:DUF4255 domain-containing protein [Nitrosomonas marina]|uniref:Pvc16 N-terminal domain-containing protein n=1 Tax=Nitrosomonas marina TaxID=917 RepID=A0A1H8C6Q3_9PROT|nr:DUF4255 domain-containing protein [Nitrosomonas marina]SEM90662.1 Protein of unknown function [Nitrosomonas marina]